MRDGALGEMARGNRSGTGAAQAPLSSPSTFKQCLDNIKEASCKEEMLAQIRTDADGDEFFERREQVAVFLDHLLACDIWNKILDYMADLVDQYFIQPETLPAVLPQDYNRDECQTYYKFRNEASDQLTPILVELKKDADAGKFTAGGFPGLVLCTYQALYSHLQRRFRERILSCARELEVPEYVKNDLSDEVRARLYYICGFLLRRLSRGPPRGSSLDFFKNFTEVHSKRGSTEDLPDTEVAEKQLYGGLIFASPSFFHLVCRIEHALLKLVTPDNLMHYGDELIHRVFFLILRNTDIKRCARSCAKEALGQTEEAGVEQAEEGEDPYMESAGSQVLKAATLIYLFVRGKDMSRLINSRHDTSGTNFASSRAHVASVHSSASAKSGNRKKSRKEHGAATSASAAGSASVSPAAGTIPASTSAAHQDATMHDLLFGHFQRDLQLKLSEYLPWAQKNLLPIQRRLESVLGGAGSAAAAFPSNLDDLRRLELNFQEMTFYCEHEDGDY